MGDATLLQRLRCPAHCALALIAALALVAHAVGQRTWTSLCRSVALLGPGAYDEARDRIVVVVCPEGRPGSLVDRGEPCCVRLAGESPAAVSAGALRSRLQARGEIPVSERSVKSPQRAVRFVGGEQSRGPNIK